MKTTDRDYYRRHGNLLIAIALCLGVCIGMPMYGCGSAQVQGVNNTAAAQYYSLTDETSRLLALSSQDMLQERTVDYLVGAEDVLEVTIFEWELREETKTVDVRVSESGVISLPVIGDIQVKGLSISETKREIEDRLVDGGFILDPRVSVIVKEFRSKRVAVVGAVVDPGVYTLRQNVTTLLDILSLAGGISDRAGYAAYIVRTRAGLSGMEEDASADLMDEDVLTGKVETVSATSSFLGSPSQLPLMNISSISRKDVMVIDLYELMEVGNLNLNVVLRDGDVVNVPEAKRFAVIGFVDAPGSLPLKKPTTVLEGIAMAGGIVNPDASPGACVLRRYTSEGETIMPLDLSAISQGKEPNFFLNPNDVIEVRQTLARKTFLEALTAARYILNVGYRIND